MFWTGLACVVLAAVVIGVSGWLLRRHNRRQSEAEMQRWREAFHRRREWLEADFHKAASNRGTPRGLAWADCDFEDDVAFARDRQTGEPTALVGVTIRFEAIAGGGMEEVEAVGNRKAATAVFRYRSGQWTTDGRAVFNLNPSETIDYYHSELERI